jgi:hypothetical protein
LAGHQNKKASQFLTTLAGHHSNTAKQAKTIKKTVPSQLGGPPKQKTNQFPATLEQHQTETTRETITQ